MQAIPFIKDAITEIHRTLLQEVQDLTPEQMAYRPSPGANPISFYLWHVGRTEDNLVHRMTAAPGTRPLWEREQWHARFGLEPSDTGTGFTAEQVASFSPDKETTLAYCQRVFQAVLAGLDGLTDDDLDRVTTPDQPQNTVARWAHIIIRHGNWHIGEVRFLKGLQGLPGYM